MSLLSFLQRDRANQNVVYVLDRLLQIAIDGDAINKSRNIDTALYDVLNKPEVNQNLIHLGCLPILREGKKISQEFAEFIDALAAYMEYDVNTNYFWANTINNPTAQKNTVEFFQSKRKAIFDYLLKKELISNSEYQDHLSFRVKDISK